MVIWAYLDDTYYLQLPELALAAMRTGTVRTLATCAVASNLKKQEAFSFGDALDLTTEPETSSRSKQCPVRHDQCERCAERLGLCPAQLASRSPPQTQGSRCGRLGYMGAQCWTPRPPLKGMPPNSESACEPKSCPACAASHPGPSYRQCPRPCQRQYPSGVPGGGRPAHLAAPAHLPWQARNAH